MELLRQAVKAGYNHAARLKQDQDLDPLRERKDFKKLLAEVAQLLRVRSNFSASIAAPSL